MVLILTGYMTGLFKGSLSLSTDVGGGDHVSLFFRSVDVALFRKLSSCFNFKLFPVSKEDGQLARGLQ